MEVRNSAKHDYYSIQFSCSQGNPSVWTRSNIFRDPLPSLTSELITYPHAPLMLKDHPMPYRSLAWHGATEGYLELLDQTKLPNEVIYVQCKSIDQVWQAIRNLAVRGAPAIGVSAAYGVVLGVRSYAKPTMNDVQKATDYLRTSRPTAVNLLWALDRVEAVSQR